MKTISNEKVCMVDIDDTLILWNTIGKGKSVTYRDPYTDDNITVYKHDNNIRLLKEKARRGFTIIAWSQGGHAHAAAVVKALGLSTYVDFCMSKPTSYIDDKPVCDWFPTRVWLDPEIKYKDSL